MRHPRPCYVVRLSSSPFFTGQNPCLAVLCGASTFWNRAPVHTRSDDRRRSPVSHNPGKTFDSQSPTHSLGTHQFCARTPRFLDPPEGDDTDDCE
ncbi:hypothetical protein B296_00054076 [Ensete ventricosum]|uniref:Uncharacterized protein n=1 Tax=Ensete ventricosum TaxID=4639 RepID=A0A426Y578_ENSVE|nr:hypothetical protein B296_00054076 [Ensete ventricosum]